MDPLALRFALLVPPAIVAAKLLVTALYRRRIRSLMREVRHQIATIPSAPQKLAAGRRGPARPNAAEIQRWVDTPRRRSRWLLPMYLAAAIAYVVPGALVLLLYIEPGGAPPLAVLVTSALLSIALLPAVLTARLRSLSAAGVWTQAAILGVPIGTSLAVGGPSLVAGTTPLAVLLVVLQTCLLAGAGFLAALAYLRFRVYLHESVAAGPSPLRFIELSFLGATFNALVSGAGSQRAWAFLGPFVLLLTVLGAGFRFLARSSRSTTAPNILLLRVFGNGRTAEALLSRLADILSNMCALRWVSSSDVAAATVSPRGMLAYLTGRLRTRFVATEADLDRVLGEGADQYLDGSFRTREIACFENGWRPVVERLIREASVVLMDLRGFTAANRGCVHELGLLVNLVPASHVMLLVDATTDEAQLSLTLDEAWAGLRPDSPNRSASPRQFRKITLNRLDRRTAAALADDVLRAAAAPGSPAPVAAVSPLRSA
ncbi:hypothetical protein ACSRUE_27520 [Sorangium sp. KYC3313]|uniref:hypothetical protein n=1 Tax=Sorangium sp. KYC3313 TaxID=3449740 RepID=UPI003F8C6F2C